MSDAQDQETVAWLAGRDAPCPICSYNVRDARRAACPECGATLSLTLTSPSLAIGPWSLAIISFALALGFDGVMLTVLLIALAIEGRTPPPPAIFVILTLAVMGAASATGLATVIKRRRAIQRRERRQQWRLAIAFFVLVGVGHAIAGAAIMAGFGAF